MLVAMRRVDIVTPRSQAEDVLRTIHRAGTVQLVPFEPRSSLAASVFSTAPPGSRRELVDSMLAEVSALAGSLANARPPVALVEALWSADLDGLRAEVEALEPVHARVNQLLAEHARLEAEGIRLVGYRRVVEALRPVVGRLPSLPGYGSTAIIIQARYRGVLTLVRTELEEITDARCEMVASDISGDRVAALLVYPVQNLDRVRALLGGRDLEELTLPEELAGLPFPQLVKRLVERQRQTEAGRRFVSRKLGGIADTHGARVAALQLVLQDRAAEEHALTDAGMSDHLTVISGWVPAAQVDELRTRLAAEVGPAVCLDEVPLDRHERALAPVAIQNPPLIQAFAPLASFVSLPRYGTIDPTPTIAATFPIFVGLMVGDVGYGLVLLALLALARRRWGDVPAA